ncbi:MAG TPA: serine/threonine-protein kinase, partial [Pirellulales bacterium]
LKSPRVVRLLNLLETPDGRRYLFLEYCPGGNLRAALSRRRKQGRRFPEDWTRQVVRHVVEGLVEAHALGVVHRDVKPENILLGGTFLEALDEASFPDVKLADFGLASAFGAARRYDPLAALSGSPAYMAPEQFAGETSLSSDYYALGVVTYELLHGAPPFSGTAGELARRHQAESPVIDERLDPIWRELLTGLLAKDPEQRRASPDWVLDRLESNGSTERVPRCTRSDRPKVGDANRSAGGAAESSPGVVSATAHLRETVHRWIGVSPARAIVLGEENDEIGVVTGEGLMRYRGPAVLPAGHVRLPGVVGAAAAWDGSWWLAKDHQILRWSPSGDLSLAWQLNQRIDALAARRTRLAAATAEKLLIYDLTRPHRVPATAPLRWSGLSPALAWRPDAVCLVAEGPVAPRLVEILSDGSRGREVPLPGPCWRIVPTHSSRFCHALVLVNNEFQLAEIDFDDGASRILTAPARACRLANRAAGPSDQAFVVADETAQFWEWTLAGDWRLLMEPPSDEAIVADLAVADSRLLALVRDRRGGCLISLPCTAR